MVLPSGFNSYAEYFSSCCKFLQKNEWIFNFSVTEMFVCDVTSHIPESWAPVLSSLNEDELNSFPVYLVKESWPDSLVEFCLLSKKLKLEPSVFSPRNKLQLPELLKAGVTPKKTHEVDNFVPFIHSLCEEQNISNIVDIGSGLGYLDLFLYLKYNYTILGIEFGKKLVESSRLSYEKLQAALPTNHAGAIKYIENRVVPESINSLCDEISSYFCGSSPQNEGTCNWSPEKSNKINSSTITSSDYKEQKELMNIFEEEFADKLSVYVPVSHEREKNVIADTEEREIGDICVVGLHTCGDLCIDSLNLFMSMDRCKICTLLACCYHKIGRQSESKNSKTDLDTPTKDSFKNFPLSLALKKVVSDYPALNSILQIPFLRLAANETAERWSGMSSEKRRSQLFYTVARAVIQLYLHQNELSMKKTKRRCVTKIAVDDFNSYLICFLSRCQISTKSGEILDMGPNLISEITELWEEMKTKQKLVRIVLCLQANIQFVAESLVVIDRVKYLLENNMKHVDVVRVMDDSISPRALALCVQK